jgi:hypothetical protein
MRILEPFAAVLQNVYEALKRACRFSLLQLLIVVCVAGPIVGFWGRRRYEAGRYLLRGATRDGVTAHVLWERDWNQGYRLKYLLMHGKLGVVGKPFQGLFGGGAVQPSSRGLACIRSGIYLNGVRRDDGRAGKVWLYCHATDSISELSIPEAHEHELRFDEFQKLPTSQVWREIFVPEVAKCDQLIKQLNDSKTPSSSAQRKPSNAAAN